MRTHHDSTLTELARELPGGALVTDVDLMGPYRQDHAGLVPGGNPLAVVRAECIDHVVSTLQFANRHRVPVVTRGAGSGLSGGANALDGGIVLSLAKMDRILEIDERSRIARVESGVLNGTLAAAVAERGLWYPPDPASRDFCTIGGNVATNAGGACCLKYGVTGDHVAAVTAVLADGTIINPGGTTRKNVAGLDLLRLLVGSEGTLAVIVEVTVWLRPVTAAPATLVATFDSTTAAGEAILGVLDATGPSLLELMDSTTIAAVESMCNMGLDADGPLLLIQCDGPTAATEIDECARVCEAAGATYVGHTTDPDDGDALLHARRSALPALERLGATILDDVAVPIPAIPSMLGDIVRIADRHDVTIGTFGHAGDGNLHPTIVYDRGSESAASAARSAFDDILRCARVHGGTITGEHGVGSLKVGALRQHIPSAERALMARVKHAFDPLGILNPGRGF